MLEGRPSVLGEKSAKYPYQLPPYSVVVWLDDLRNMKGQGHGRNFLAPFVLGVVAIKRWDGFRFALTRVGLGLDARINANRPF